MNGTHPVGMGNHHDAGPGARNLIREKFQTIIHPAVVKQAGIGMKTCINISATSWPTMSVAKATRHSRYNPGCAFSQRLSLATIGQGPEVNVDDLGGSRF